MSAPREGMSAPREGMGAPREGMSAPREGMSAPRPRRGRPGYDLESLLAVAVGVFNERGYDGTSMEDLSRRLGIGKSAIYHHVESKEDCSNWPSTGRWTGWSTLPTGPGRSRARRSCNWSTWCAAASRCFSGSSRT